MDAQLMTRSIDSIRVLSADMVEKANSGHPGAPIGCAPIAYLLFHEIMNHSPRNPKWSNRDRFVLSNGHACALLYSVLHLTGYSITMDDLKNFRQLGSITPGHPENFVTPGVEVSTGPLGQGISNAVGLAMAEAHLAAEFNQPDFNIVDHHTFVLCGDGCLQEGISSEACSLAGHLGLGKLIVCYDDNHITIDGDTALSFTEDVNLRYESYGWHVQTVSDVNDVDSLRKAIEAAKNEKSKPSLIKVRTIIGHGSAKEGTHHVHGAPLGAADLAKVKQFYGFDPAQSFEIPGDVLASMRLSAVEGERLEHDWIHMFELYSKKYPHLAAEYERRMENRLPDGWKEKLPTYLAPDAKSVATRNRSEEVLNICAAALPELMGGSADLSGSNLTVLKCSGDFQKDNAAGRYIRFGVREHGMAAICNGLFAHGGIRPFCATFLNFLGYAMGAVRVSSLSRFGVIYIMTHDSIGLGEDGPTHQPIEMLECCRATPNLLTIRPADGNEVVGAYIIALERSHSPTVISLTRQAVPTVENTSAANVSLGAYVIANYGPQCARPKLILIGTGSELHLAVNVAKTLAEEDKVHIRYSILSLLITLYLAELFQCHALSSLILSLQTTNSLRFQKALQ